MIFILLNLFTFITNKNKAMLNEEHRFIEM